MSHAAPDDSKSKVKVQVSAVLCISLFLISISISLFLGPSGWITLPDIVSCFTHANLCDQWTVVQEIRLPRLLNGAVVGLSLAAAGVLSQGFFRNDLASPSVTGAEAAGLLGAATAFVLSQTSSHLWACPLGAGIGVASVSVLLGAIRTRMSGVSTTVILLFGIAISSLCSAFISLIITLLSSDPFQTGALINWIMGSLSSRSWSHLQFAGPLALIGWIWGYRLSSKVDYLSFGEDFSNSVGISIKALEFQLLMVIACLVGASVSIAGGIVFVGLVVPHVSRQLFGPHHRRLMQWSSINGITLVVLADFVAKTAIDREINTGVVIALIGAPFFSLLLLRRTRISKIREGNQ